MIPSTFMLDRSTTCLVVIDVQDSLLKLMPDKTVAEVVANLSMTIRVFKKLGLPILWTEQYKKGLGGTTQALDDLLQGYAAPLDKVEFSCMQVQEFRDQLMKLAIRQVLVVGMETHVCVLQTVVEMLAAHYDVHVPCDGVLSRFKTDWATGLRIIKRAGAITTSVETALFQLFRKAGGSEFKYFSGLLKDVAETRKR